MVRFFVVLTVFVTLSLSFAATRGSLIGTTIKPGVDYKFNLKRTDVDKALGNVAEIIFDAATEPVIDSKGKTTGFKLTYIKPTSIFEKLGLAEGDTIKSINGRKVESAIAALELFTELRDSSSIKVQIERTGKTSNLTYLIK